MPKLSIRVDFGKDRRLGPGKIQLLEQIASHGSISAGGRALEMSYRRAWELVAELNDMFGKPLVASKSGGKNGGGAELTALGHTVIMQYRAIEKAAAAAVEPHIAALAAARRGD